MSRRKRAPELMGAREVAAHLGVAVSNLDRQAGLPEPIQELRCGRIWLAADVREFDRKRRARRAA